MLTLADFETRLVASLDDAAIAERYQAGDPLVVQQVRANAAYLALLAREIDVATIEPFIKTRDRSILADATNKGILPVATACQHTLTVSNSGAATVTLSQGRLIEDSNGRPWRLLASVTVAGGATGDVLAEQSELRQVTYSVPLSEPFHRVPVTLQAGLLLAGLTILDTDVIPNTYRHAPRWMNVSPLEYAVTITTDSLRRVLVEFGDDLRAGRTVATAQQFVFQIIESYGSVDTATLKDAALSDVLTTAEQKVRVRFKVGGLVRAGADPLSIGQLRLLASYPALYDENAVFLGSFDFLARKKFMARVDYLAVWNETIQERAYGVVELSDINHLNIATVAKNPLEQATVVSDIQQLIGRSDSLYDGRVKVRAVVERPYQLLITGRLAAVHDLDTVAAQIRGLLTAKYGKGTIAASRWMPDGINLQEISRLMRGNITAFQDRISDFVVGSENLGANTIKPHEWLYLTDASITVTLSRTADTGGSLWTL
jgi:hypothetical protein